MKRSGTNSKKNVLVFPCGSEIGLEVYRSLYASTHFNLFGGSTVDDHGKFVYPKYIDGIPHVDDLRFADKINEIIHTYNIDFIIPAHDSVLVRLAQEKADAQLNAQLITSPLATCIATRSKASTYQLLKDFMVTPRIYENIEDIKPMDFPVFLKPDIGQGSKGVYIANDSEQVEFYKKIDPSLLILEYLPGREYTVDCFTDKAGKLLFCEGRERTRVANGISVSSSTVNDRRFRDFGETICQKMDFRGVWFFQVKENAQGELSLMEIAPRVAGTMALVRCRGVNLVLLSLFDALGYAVSVFENNYNLVIDRALSNSFRHNISYKHVYLDFDDLVIFENRVNPAVIAFVYQCLNNGVKVHLLTKHKENIRTTLNKYRLSGIFDDVIWIKGQEEKCEFINEKDAILIDDSFVEREKVHNIRGIPVFDSHMIESLMEKF